MCDERDPGRPVLQGIKAAVLACRRSVAGAPPSADNAAMESADDYVRRRGRPAPSLGKKSMVVFCPLASARMIAASGDGRSATGTSSPVVRSIVHTARTYYTLLGARGP